MRLAVISDIHGNQVALQAVLNDLQTAGSIDKTWVLGDLCAFGPRPVECLQIIRELPNAEVISGNTDRYLVTGERPKRHPKDEADWQHMAEQLRIRDENFIWTVWKLSFADYEYLSKLGHNLGLYVDNYGPIIGYHAVPGNDERAMMPDTDPEEVLDNMCDREGRLGFGGHTHLPMDRDLGRWRVVNVGSVGMPFDNDSRACYVIATFENDEVHLEFRRVEYDVDAVIHDLQESGNPSWEWTASKLKGHQ